MKFLICGSAAAEGMPAIFCECATCAMARKLGGKNIRMRATYNVGGKAHIDFGPDILAQDYKFSLRLERLEHLFFTHSHGDHLQSFEFKMRQNGFSKVKDVLNVYGNDAVRKSICQDATFPPEICKLKFHPLLKYKTVAIKNPDLAFTPVEADHAPSEEAFLFSIQSGKSKVFVGNDTGWFPDGTWDFLKGNRHDIFILDATYCKVDSTAGHMGGKAVLETIRELKKLGAADQKTVFVVNHFSHNGGMMHADLEKYFAPHGIKVGFDGMDLDF